VSVGAPHPHSQDIIIFFLMRPKAAIAVIALMAVCIVATTPPPTSYYVSYNGSVSYPGTKLYPFVTVSHAMEVVRMSRQSSTCLPEVSVFLRRRRCRTLKSYFVDGGEQLLPLLPGCRCTTYLSRADEESPATFSGGTLVQFPPFNTTSSKGVFLVSEITVPSDQVPQGTFWSIFEHVTRFRSDRVPMCSYGIQHFAELNL